MYNPLYGFKTNLIKDPKAKDQFAKFKKVFNSNVQEKALVWNDSQKLINIIVPIDRSLVREILVKELDVTYKEPVMPGLRLGIFQKSGDDAMQKRGIFSKFFHKDNFDQILPKIEVGIRRGISRLQQKYWPTINNPSTNIESLPWVSINMSEEVDELLGDMVSLILFNEESPRTIDGKKMAIYIKDQIETQSKSHLKKSRYLTSNIIQYLGLDSGRNKSNQMYECLSKACLQMYKERETLRETVPCPKEEMNFLDMIIEENKVLPDSQKWNSDDISENIALIHLAGFDTTSLTFTTALTFFTQDQDMTNKLNILSEEIYSEDSQNGHLITAQRYMDNLELEEVTMEMLRLYSPSFFSTRRVISKNCKIGGFNFRKDDFILVPFALKHHSNDIFPKAGEFIQKRFSKEKKDRIEAPEDRYDFASFGLGKRNCIGQYFAKTMLKCLMTNIFKNFEVKSDEEAETKMIFKFFYGINKAQIIMKPKRLAL